jgi:hypothetical protein
VSSGEEAKRSPAISRQLQSKVVAGTALLIAAVLFAPVTSADHPLAATGIALQTAAGLLATVQLWANNASDALIRWMAHQVETNRWHIAGFLNGHDRSLLLATAWYLAALGGLRLFSAWDPPGALGWSIAIPLLLVSVLSALALVLTALMYAGGLAVGDGEPLPDGRALTTLEARLNGNDWIWPLVGLVVVVGGLLQIAAA